MKKTAINVGIVAVILGILLLIPTDILPVTRVLFSQNKIAYDTALPSIAGGRVVSQKFVPQFDSVESIKICVRGMNCDMSQGYVLASIYDAEDNFVCEEKLPLSEITSFGWHRVINEIKLNAGETYRIDVEVVEGYDDGPNISYYNVPNVACIEQDGQEMTYNGATIDGGVLKMYFEYNVPVTKLDYVVYYFFVIFIVGFAVTRIKKAKNK